MRAALALIPGGGLTMIVVALVLIGGGILWLMDEGGDRREDALRRESLELDRKHTDADRASDREIDALSDGALIERAKRWERQGGHEK